MYTCVFTYSHIYIYIHTIYTYKGAGLSLEDALIFWESHFSKIMNHDEFMKKHSYNIRHNYGKEGARKDYTPPSCNKIILGTAPEAGAYHGCPYR